MLDQANSQAGPQSSSKSKCHSSPGLQGKLGVEGRCNLEAAQETADGAKQCQTDSRERQVGGTGLGDAGGSVNGRRAVAGRRGSRGGSGSGREVVVVVSGQW